MINIKKLIKEDIGREVKYVSRGGDKIEFGKITSWNDIYIFVRYTQQIEPEKRFFTGDTSQATRPEDLSFNY